MHLIQQLVQHKQSMQQSMQQSEDTLPSIFNSIIKFLYPKDRPTFITIFKLIIETSEIVAPKLQKIISYLILLIIILKNKFESQIQQLEYSSNLYIQQLEDSNELLRRQLFYKNKELDNVKQDLMITQQELLTTNDTINTIFQNP